MVTEFFWEKTSSEWILDRNRYSRKTSNWIKPSRKLGMKSIRSSKWNTLLSWNPSPTILPYSSAVVLPSLSTFSSRFRAATSTSANAHIRRLAATRLGNRRGNWNKWFILDDTWPVGNIIQAREGVWRTRKNPNRVVLRRVRSRTTFHPAPTERPTEKGNEERMVVEAIFMRFGIPLFPFVNYVIYRDAIESFEPWFRWWKHSQVRSIKHWRRALECLCNVRAETKCCCVEV